MASRNRDDFTEETKRIIACRVAYCCSHPNCDMQTAGPVSDPTKFYNVGVASHITAAASGGPRFDSALTRDERKHPDNGIWLCQTHGKEVDDDEVTFPADVLRTWKIEAENRARARLGKARDLGPNVGVCADVSKGERYGLATEVLLEDGSRIASASPFDVEEQKPTYYFESAFVIRFLVAKRPSADSILIWEVRAIVYQWSPLPKFRPIYYAQPVQVNPYIVNLAPPTEDRPRPCVAEVYFFQDRPDALRHTPIAITSEIPEVIDVRFNATQPGVYKVALDVTICCGVEKRTYRVLDQTDVLFLKPWTEEDDAG